MHLCATRDWQAWPVDRVVDTVGLPRSGSSAPIVVCTRNDALGPVVDRVHPDRRADLVFVQNGMVQPWLAERQLEECTQGVLYVAVTHVGATPVGGGTSVFCGRHAEALAGLLNAGGVAAEAVSPEVYARELAVKLAWICVFGLLGEVHRCKVGALATTHREEVAGLAAELHPLLVAEPGLDLDADTLVARLLEYGASIPHFPSRLKEWRWRNGWVVEAAERHGLPLPLHEGWLERAGISPEGQPTG